MVTKLKLFFLRPYVNFHLCSGGFLFSGKVFPYFKIGQNKCPFSFLATDFRKKICHLFEENFFGVLFFKNSLHYVVKAPLNNIYFKST